jgi:hypothetical protein
MSRTGGLSGKPDAGSVAALEVSADTSGTDADWRAWQASVVRQALEVLSGQGRTLAAARERLTEIAERLDELGAASGSMRDVVRSYADEVAEVQSSASGLREAEPEAVARASRYRLLVLDGDRTLGRPPWQAPPDRRLLREPRVVWELGQWHEAVTDHDDVTRRWRDLVGHRADLDERTARNLDDLPGLSALRERTTGSEVRPAMAVGAAPWSGPGTVVRAADLAALGDADAVRAVWDQLDEVQRRSLISNEPMITGNLNGIPIQFRAEANRLNMQAEIARIDRLLAVVGQASPHNELRSGETIPALRTLRADLIYYLTSEQRVFDAYGEPEAVVGVPVVAFDVERNSIATYHGAFDAGGDVPQWVANVAIHVPGTGTTVPSFRGTDDRVSDIFGEANSLIERQGAGPTAMFAWACGRFPQGLEAVSDVYSRDLGPGLRDFAGAIDVRPGSSTLTVTGHSYGGAVVGRAEAEGLRADRILYVSGAGIGNGNGAVASFPHTGSVPRYALMARNDLIVGYSQDLSLGSAGHGSSALGDPGVVRLETGFLEGANTARGKPVESLGMTGSHSGVYRTGSTAFSNIVQTIVGGRVETYAPDESHRVHLPGETPQVVMIDGILRKDYVPRYVDVK